MAHVPSPSPTGGGPPPEARARILEIAVRLLAEGGRDALTTRAVAAAAGIQQPTLYRLFGDKTGLLEAAAEHGLAAYVDDKASLAADPDPLMDFRAGWDRHVGFGLAHPALFAIIWGDPDPARVSPAAEAGQIALRSKVHAMATAGLLRISEARAARLAHAACTGAVLSMLGTPTSVRDPELAADAREAVIGAITLALPDVRQPGPASAAITLRAMLDQPMPLTPGERHFLDELLDRIAGVRCAGST